ncbi:plasmid stabilization protein [Rhizobium leguminosarum bv. trifolii]|uniref:Plasmid stabilization protein n=1 Tax=Rhizobium leguminosarum bv. trifolii TaxID=386 RepID=A0A3E1BQZ1_RHILT|nr:type II toxin-antitoxin system RelE/ParE family toxin [Rhizobium leguminosarum]RFB94643.1 plasmid stabilization protein [Rhizobium leguminosarum bv. trifolii]RFB96015.1 plasmid stabilization protein [Rhizobium leguminosarum bv. trifolii]
MRRAKVVYRPEALGDLRQIYLDIAGISQSNVTANRFVKRIMARCRKIGDAPNGGRPRNDLAMGLRIVPFEHSAVIAYHVAEAVEIVNIFYGGRNYEALFRSGDDEAEL